MAAAQQFLFTSDSGGGQNQFVLASDNPQLIAIAAGPTQQGQQSSATMVAPAAAIAAVSQQPQQSSAALTAWVYVTLLNPINFGPGSVADLTKFYGSPPKAGDVIAYDATNLLIATDGSLSWSAYGSAQCQYNDGTGWVPFIVTCAPWGAVSQQSQQATAAAVTVTAQIAATTQQQQQSYAQVGFVGTVAAGPTQQTQQGAAFLRVTAQVSSNPAQQSQQTSADLTVQAKIAATSQQIQQSVAQVSAVPQIAAGPTQQGQQTSADIIAQIKPAIAAGPTQQLQQTSVGVSVQAVIAASSQQSQQTSADVLVPQPVPIVAGPSQQAQQSSAAVSAAAGVSSASQQSQQSVAGIAAAPVIAAGPTQQGQQSIASMPTLGAPVIAAGPTQHAQQSGSNVLAFPRIAAVSQQSQQSFAAVTPLPSQIGDIDPESITIGSAVANDSTPDTKTIYLGRDNSALIVVYQNGKPLDELVNATRIQIGLVGTSTVIDSNASPDLMDWSMGGGIIRMKLGMLPITPGLYEVWIAAYDFAHPDGQVIAGSAGPVLKLDFVQDMAA